MYARPAASTFRIVSVILIIVLLGAVGYLLATTPGTKVNTSTNTLTNIVTTTQAGFKGSFCIGLLAPFTGFEADYGPQYLNGLTLAADEINAAGGVLGNRIQIFTADEGNGGAQAINAYNELVLKNGCRIVLGPN